MTLWLVPSKAAGLRVGAKFDGLGLRGNAANPVSGAGVVVPAGARKAVAAEAAAEVADGALRLCGAAAFRKALGIERLFRDALAARVMAPTTGTSHDFVGRTCLGLPLFDPPRA